MCLTFFYLNSNSSKINLQQTQFLKSLQFIIGFNRDQQIKRQTKQFNKFDQDQNIYAGRDFISGGTWLGINVQTGIMVILTNYDIIEPRYGKSRGKVVYKILSTKFISQAKLTCLSDVDQRITNHLTQILKDRQNYSPFNLVVYSIFTKKLHYMCSQLDIKEPIILNRDESYGMCNCQISVFWPKTKHGLLKFKQVVKKLNEKYSANQVVQQLQQIFKDKKLFSQNLQDQSSIFVEPYYCIAEKAQRMTKSTFYGVLQKSNEQKGGYTFHIKQVTYDKDLNQQQKIVNVQISLQKFTNKYLNKVAQHNQIAK